VLKHAFPQVTQVLAHVTSAYYAFVHLFSFAKQLSRISFWIMLIPRTLPSCPTKLYELESQELRQWLNDQPT